MGRRLRIAARDGLLDGLQNLGDGRPFDPWIDERVDVFQVLPMEFAVEAQALLAISLEGSVG